jgi:hypothetical protein
MISWHGGASLQENAARGFTAMATTTLHLINVLTLNPIMAAKFTADNVVGRSAYAVISFLESLLGPKRAAIQVGDVTLHCSVVPRTHPIQDSAQQP